MDLDELRMAARIKGDPDSIYRDDWISQLLSGAADEIERLREQVRVGEAELGHETAKLRVARKLLRGR